PVPRISVPENGAPGETRTPDQPVRSRLLYTTELQRRSAARDRFCGCITELLNFCIAEPCVLRNLTVRADQLAALRRQLLPMSSRPVEQLSIGSNAIKPVIAILADP